MHFVNNIDLFVLLKKNLKTFSDSTKFCDYLKQELGLQLNEENKVFFSKFCQKYTSNMKRRWIDANHTYANFIKKNEKWLERQIVWPSFFATDGEQGNVIDIELSENIENQLPSIHEASTSFTPRKTFENLSSKPKRRLIQILSDSLSPEQLTRSTVKPLNNNGNEDLSRISKHLFNRNSMIDIARNHLKASKMADEITLTSMAAFDFSSPMNVAINYDDSDEDTKDIINLLRDEDQPKCSDEQSTLEKKTSNLTNKRKIENNQLNNSSCENILLENKRSRFEVDDKNNNKHEIPPIQKNPTGQHIVSNCNNHTAESTETTTTCKSPNEEINFNKNNGTLNNIDVDVMRKEFQEVRNYIHTLLKTVSEHLILIINAYIDHSRIANEYQNRPDGHLRIQDSKARYYRYKNHIFQLSYSAVVSVILEQEMNTGFIDALMDNTVKIAHGKYQLQYTAQYIKPFFYDMLFWAKQKRNYMNSNPAHEIQKSKEANKNNTPILTKQLSQPALVPQPLRLPKSSKKGQNKEKNCVVDRTSDQSQSLSKNAGCQEPQFIQIFRCGPPDREVGLSIQSSLLHIQNQQMAQITNMPNQLPPPLYPNPPNYSRPENYYHTNQHNQYANNNVVNNLAPSGNSNMAVAPTATYNNNHQHIIHSVNERNKQYYDQMRGANNSYPTRSYIGQPFPSLREFRAHNSPNVQQCNPHYQHQFVSPDINKSGNLEDRNVQNLQNTSISPNNVIESGRSVSTDSGFASPLQFNTGGDKTPAEPIEHSTQFAPLITHVTSLNPNAVQIAEGSCYVCRKPTKTKCMGCYQVYYCNYQCENADWSLHMNICKRSTESQQVKFV